MMPLESSASYVTIWSITVESSIVILEASFSLIYEINGTGIIMNENDALSPSK
jgi:hypothetical protein